MTNVPSIQKSFCTTREAAELLGVSLRTAQLWTERGLLEAWKTSGGHRRISRESVERLLAHSPVPLTSPLIPPATLETPKLQVRTAKPVPLNVLIVEDEETQRLIYEVSVTSWPMKPRVTSAGDGYEALIRIGHQRPDLLITDLNMPGMNGFRMLRTIRSMPELAGLEIIVVSGLEPDIIERNGGVPEGVMVFPKPAPFARLFEIAERVAMIRGRLQAGVVE